jgi:hypothetical protein
VARAEKFRRHSFAILADYENNALIFRQELYFGCAATGMAVRVVLHGINHFPELPFAAAQSRLGFQRQRPLLQAGHAAETLVNA